MIPSGTYSPSAEVSTKC